MQRLKFYSLVLLGAIACVFSLADRSVAVDHNNIDANRPLNFDDADSIGFREQAIDLGAALTIPEGKSVGGEFEIEYLYGFARNTHLNIGIDPSIEEDNDETEFSIGDLSVGVLHNFNRVYNNTPAFALRSDVAFPTGNDSEGVDFRLRGIASKTVGQYNRFHLNLDANFATSTEEKERSFVPGVILGYSRPIGYPTNFTRTFVGNTGYAGCPAGINPRDLFQGFIHCAYIRFLDVFGRDYLNLGGGFFDGLFGFGRRNDDF